MKWKKRVNIGKARTNVSVCVQFDLNSPPFANEHLYKMELNAKRGSTLAKHGRMLVSAYSLNKTHPNLLMSTDIKWNESEKNRVNISEVH